MAETGTLKQQHKTYQVNIHYPPFVFDWVARWFALGIYRGMDNNADPESNLAFIFFIIVNVIITLITAYLAYIRYSELKKWIEEKNKVALKPGEMRTHTYDYENKFTVVSLTFIILIIASVSYILYAIISEQTFYMEFVKGRDGANAVAPILTLFLYGTTTFTLSFLSVTYPLDYQEEQTLTKPKKQKKRKATTEESEVLEQELALIEEQEDEKLKSIDDNDLEIVRLEGAIKNETTRVDAYILESVLFGALAFSAFLTIIASERFNFTPTEYENLNNVIITENDTVSAGTSRVELLKSLPAFMVNEDSTGNPVLEEEPFIIQKAQNASEVKQFSYNLYQLLIEGVLLFDFDKGGEAWEELLKARNLIILIMFETLFCSLFFISVIVSRIRYTKIAEEIDNLIRLARSFNDKEEEVFNLRLQVVDNEVVEQNLERRLNILDHAIERNIVKVKLFRNQTKPIVLYMTVLRNMGVFTFILILITSSLFFSRSLATIFVVLAILAYAYESMDSWLRLRRVRGIKTNE